MTNPLVAALLLNAVCTTASALVIGYSFRKIYNLITKHTEDICIQIGILHQATIKNLREEKKELKDLADSKDSPEKPEYRPE